MPGEGCPVCHTSSKGVWKHFITRAKLCTCEQGSAVFPPLPVIPPLPEGQSTGTTHMPPAPASCPHSPTSHPSTKTASRDRSQLGSQPVSLLRLEASLFPTPQPPPLVSHDLPLSCFSPSFSHSASTPASLSVAISNNTDYKK